MRLSKNGGVEGAFFENDSLERVPPSETSLSRPYHGRSNEGVRRSTFEFFIVPFAIFEYFYITHTKPESGQNPTPHDVGKTHARSV